MDVDGGRLAIDGDEHGLHVCSSFYFGAAALVCRVMRHLLRLGKALPVREHVEPIFNMGYLLVAEKAADIRSLRVQLLESEELPVDAPAEVNGDVLVVFQRRLVQLVLLHEAHYLPHIVRRRSVVEEVVQRLLDGTMHIHGAGFIACRGEAEARVGEVGLLGAGVVREDGEVVPAAEAHTQKLEFFRDAAVVFFHDRFLPSY